MLSADRETRKEDGIIGELGACPREATSQQPGAGQSGFPLDRGATPVEPSRLEFREVESAGSVRVDAGAMRGGGGGPSAGIASAHMAMSPP
jgi:hypothetical protein